MNPDDAPPAKRPNTTAENVFSFLIMPAYGIFYCSLYLLVGMCGFAAWLTRLDIEIRHGLSVTSSPRRGADSDSDA